MNIGIASALAAACLFGASTPVAKSLLGEVDPALLAGLLYLGSGVGLSLFLLLSSQVRLNAVQQANHITRKDLPWLCAAVSAGGIIGPLLLMKGLETTAAASASLLLNLEGVMTALLAWFVFKENFDRRIFTGMMLIIAGGVALTWSDNADFQAKIGLLWIVGACLAWAIDNNFTRKISSSNAIQLAAIKGCVAGLINTAAALALGSSWPKWSIVWSAALTGVVGYGASLALFVVALRQLGTARTAAYFSTGPFIGAAVSVAILGESSTWYFWLAALFMGLGVWLHLSERHGHSHVHEAIDHTHQHDHDEHHRHGHGFEWDNSRAHSHEHKHEALSHSHRHFPDIHHRHDH